MNKLLLASAIAGLAAIGSAQAAPLILWGNNASYTDVVESFDPTTGAVINQFSLPALGGSGNGRGVVIVGNTGYYTQAGSGLIGEFNATTGAYVGSLSTGLSGFASITYDGTDFWVSDYAGNNNVYRIDIAGNVVKTISLSLCGGYCDGLNYYQVGGQGRLISNQGDGETPATYDVYDTNGNLITANFINTAASAEPVLPSTAPISTSPTSSRTRWAYMMRAGIS